MSAVIKAGLGAAAGVAVLFTLGSIAFAAFGFAAVGLMLIVVLGREVAAESAPRWHAVAGVSMGLALAAACVGSALTIASDTLWLPLVAAAAYLTVSRVRARSVQAPARVRTR